jgi:hypothetical protein
VCSLHMYAVIPDVNFAKIYPSTILLSLVCGKCYRNRTVAFGFGGRSVVDSVPNNEFWNNYTSPICLRCDVQQHVDRGSVQMFF